MDKAIVELAKALNDEFERLRKDLQEIGVSLVQLCDVILNQERRLQKLENPDIRCELVDIKRFIEDIKGPEKKEAAMAEFAALCHALGLEDLEEF